MRKKRNKILVSIALLVCIIMVGAIFINKKEEITYSKIYGGKVEEDFVKDIYISENN